MRMNFSSRMLAGLVLVATLAASACAAEEPVGIAAPAVDEPRAAGPLRTAVIAGGCFWGVQGVYQHVKGVKRVLSGYAGGARETAQYERVGGGDTGHAESVEIIYDPAQVTYGELLQVFFSVVHDPTQLNRQGPDSGTQYRSAIFFGDESQKKVAEAYIAQLDKAGVFRRRIVTRVDALRGFYAAEDYHQDYLLEHPKNPYIAINDLPKVANFKRMFPVLYNPLPVRVAGNKTRPVAQNQDHGPVGGAMMAASAGRRTHSPSVEAATWP